MTADNETIPFGKYKGQSVEVLQQDRGYCEWLMGQDWLQTKFPSLRTIIINNFAEPTETPEHNALQARLLDDRFKMGLVRLVMKGKFPSTNVIECGKSLDLSFEYRGADVVIHGASFSAIVTRENDKELFDKCNLGRMNDAEEKYRSLSSKVSRLRAYPETQVSDWIKGDLDKAEADLEKVADHIHSIQHTTIETAFVVTPTIGIEIKPSMGDDYPAVLRQIMAMRTDGVRVLVLGNYSGVGATLEQVRAIFDHNKIYLALVKEIEAVAETL